MLMFYFFFLQKAENLRLKNFVILFFGFGYSRVSWARRLTNEFCFALSISTKIYFLT